MAIGTILLSQAANAQLVSINETFTGTTLSSGWQVGGSGSTAYTPNLTAASGIDSAGSGWMRLTSATNYESSFAYDSNSFSSANATVALKFNYASYGTTSTGGIGADGITFFLADASKTFGVGAYGGSLGYAQRTLNGGGGADTNGMSGGYIGLGLDEYGNYAAATEGRSGGISGITGKGSQSEVAVRGPGQNLTGYDYLGGTGILPTTNPIAFAASSTRPTGVNQRTFEVIITASNQLTVYMQAGAGAALNPLYSIDLSGYTRPDNLVLGFTGSTGGDNDIHEVQGLSLTSQAARLWTNVGATSTWSSASNWDGGSAIPAVGADILLDNHYVSSAQTISVGAGTTRSIRSLQIDAPFSYTLDSSTINNGTLQFNDQGVLGPSGIFVSQGHGTAVQTVNSNLIANNAIEIKNQSTSALNLNGTLANGGNVVTLSGTGTTNLSGVISGTGSITKNDGGTAAISGNNTYSGGTALTAGTITVGHNNALGTGAVTLTGGTLSSSASNTISNALSVQGNTTLSNITTAGTLTQSGGNYAVTMLNANQTGGVSLSEGNTGRTLGVQVDTGTSTISGVIQDGGTGAGGLTKIGVGTLTLSGANTYTGTSTINGGTLQLGGNDRLAATSGLNISAMGNFNLAGFSQKVGTLTAAGGASIDFGAASGANTFVFGSYVAPASGVLVINNWESSLDKLATTGAGQNVSTIYISGAGVAQEAGSSSALGGTYGNGYLLTPVAAVYKEWNGSGGTTWSTSSNWTAANAPLSTQVALFNSLGIGQKTPYLDSSQTIAGIRFGSGATVSYNLTGKNGRILTLTGTVPYIQQQSANAQTIAVSGLALANSTVADITAAGNLTISSAISGTGFSLIKDGTGAGKLILSGANTFTGGLFVNNGIAQANNNAALGTGAATVSSGATLEVSGGRTITNAISVGGAGVGSAGAIHNVNGSNTLSAAVTETGATTFAADTGTTLNLSGGLTGTNIDTIFSGAGSITTAAIATGTGGVTVNGTGTVTFNGGTTANTYTGTTTVNSGKLFLNKTAGTTAVAGNLVIGSGTGGARSAVVQLGAADQMVTSAVTMGSDGLFDLNGQNETITSLTGSGNIDNTNAGVAKLTVGDTTSTAFSGVIQDLGGSLSLVKQGSGKLTLSGANSYSGTTSLNAGILTIQHNTALGTGVLTVVSGGNLQVAGNLTNVANAMLLNGPGTLANGGAVESYSGSNTLSGLLTLQSASRIQADSGSTLTVTGDITGAGQALSLGGAGNIAINGNITTSTGGTLTKDGTGYVTLKPGAGTSSFTGATAINAGTLEIQNNSALGATSGATVASGATLAVSGNLTSGAALNLSGQGVGNYGALRNLSGANTMSGAIALNAATTVGVDAGTLTASGAISGATGSDLTKVGTGTLTISGAGANTMAGNFNVNDGTVILNKTAGVDATGNGTGALTIGDGIGAANSATVQLAANSQINTATAVTINSDGKLDVNSKTQQIGSLAGSGSVALGTGNVLTVGNASNTTFSGAVSTTGTGAVTKTGTGTLLLQQTAGSNSFAAATLNLTQGTVQLGASNILNSALNFNGGSLSVNGFNDTVSGATLTSSSIVDFNSLAGVFNFTNGLYTAGTLTINNWAGSISGGGASQLRLPGTVTGALLANISFSGYGAGAQIVNGEIVPITGTSYSWNVDTDGTWSNNANWNPGTNNPNGVGQSATFGNVITASRTVTLDTARTVGYLTFNSTNNYTIASASNRLTFAVSSGNAQLNVSGAGAETVSAGVNLSNALVINQNSTGTLTLSNANAITGTAQNLTVGGSGNTVISGIIATTSGSLTKNNGGTLTLGGVNTYSGGTTINGGNVAISADNNLGAATGALTLNGGTLENTANLTLTAGRVVSVGASGGTFQTDGVTNLIYNGVVTGAGPINKTGTGTFTTGGASANTQTGAININSGVFEIAKTANVSAIGDTSAVTVASGATLKLNGTGGYIAETIGSLAGAGTVTNASANAHALTVGGDGTSTTFSGALQNTGGALSLTKTGAGTMTLTDTGGLSNYTGTTTVSQGVLNIQASTALGANTGGAATVASGAALEVEGNLAIGSKALTLNGTGLTSNANGALRNVSGNNSMAGAITLGSAATIKSEAGTLTLSGAVGGAGQNLTLDGSGNSTLSGAIGTTTGSLTKNGTGYATLSGNSTFSGGTSINAGTLEIQNGNALGSASGGATVASGATLALSGNITSAVTPITLNGVGDGSAGALRSLSGTNTLSGTSVVLASSSLVGVDAGTLTVSGVVSGAGNLTKVGAGTLVLSGANSYSGATFINAGTVQIDSDQRLGPAPGGATSGQLTLNGGTLATTATMTLSTNRGISLAAGGGTISTAAATTTTFGGVVDGSGGLTKAGAGTLVLTGTNTYLGATNVNGGTLSISSDAQLGTAPASATAGQLSFNGGTLATTASMTLNANRGIMVNAGGGTISVANANTLTFGGTIAGTGNLSLALNGSGLIDLTSNVNFSSGTLLLSGGTLLLSGVNLSVGTFHITGNTILDFGNSVASTLTATNFIVDAGVSVTVNNWVNGSDAFFANSSFTQNGGPSAVYGARGSAPENQVTFAGFSNNSTGWISYDHEITPVPEPSLYGAVFLGSCLTLLGWRRWKKHVPSAV